MAKRKHAGSSRSVKRFKPVGTSTFYGGVSHLAKQAWKHRGLVKKGYRIGKGLAKVWYNRVNPQKKREAHNVQTESMAGKITRSVCSLQGKSRYLKAKIVGAPVRNQLNFAAKVTCSAGTQNYATDMIGNIVELSTLLTLCHNNLESTVNSTLTNDAIKDSKMFLKYMTQEITYTNQSLKSMYLTIYDVKCIRDTNSDAYVAMQNSTGHNAGQDGVERYETVTGKVDDNYGVVGFRPTDASSFGVFYHIYKTTRVHLNPGESHKHITYVKYNKWFSQSVNQYGSAIYTRGWAVGVMASFYGSLTEGSTNNSVDTGYVDLDRYIVRRYHARGGVFTKTATIQDTRNMVSQTGNSQYVQPESGYVFRDTVGIQSTLGNL